VQACPTISNNEVTNREIAFAVALCKWESEGKQIVKKGMVILFVCVRGGTIFSNLSIAAVKSIAAFEDKEM
jgi:hypothetical protein